MLTRILVAVLVVATAVQAKAAVVVIANRTDRPLTFTTTAKGAEPVSHTVVRRDLVVVPVSGSIVLAYTIEGKTQKYQLAPDAAFYFAEEGDSLRFGQIGSKELQARQPAEGKVKPAAPVLVLPVKILVDEEEPGVRRAWEARLRKRVAAASEVLERQCRVRLDVTEVETWQSDDAAKDFPALLKDFEKKVSPRPAKLAIGFTSQRLPPGTDAKSDLGGVVAPLHPYILIREWTPPTESERVELLLHELGHYLGAVHSPEVDSLMYPKLVAGKGRGHDYRVGFDPLNALAMNLVVAEAGARPTKELADLPEATREHLNAIYEEIGRADPKESTTKKYLRLLDAAAEKVVGLPKTPDALVDGARTVVSAVVDAAARERGRNRRISGDERTEIYVRAAAAAALKLPEGRQVPAFLLGLGVALDDAELLRKNPVTRDLWKRVEDDEERAERLKVLGEPTIHGRHDWAQHYSISGALTAVAGVRAAESAGILKELLDANGGSGFSFADLAADLGGVRFGRYLLDDPKRLKGVSETFRVADFAIKPTGLTDGLTRQEFAREYGSTADERYKKLETSIRRRIDDLPPYQKASK